MSTDFVGVPILFILKLFDDVRNNTGLHQIGYLFSEEIIRIGVFLSDGSSLSVYFAGFTEKNFVKIGLFGLSALAGPAARAFWLRVDF
mmetsp:Transcript_45244/g.60044  ORF Transcript_45244/g.60044 Transcript_45244/m.60044 type:complete len:88 (-) Transcript_45244:512-775(-)